MKTIDLFCGAGGITEGFRQAGFSCLYGNDCDSWSIQTFSHNHPTALADCGPIESVHPRRIRAKLGLAKGELDVLVGGPPCQGFSINAPGRFLADQRNALFKYYIQFMKEFKPKAFLFENVPGMLSLAHGRVFRQVISELEHLGYAVAAKILFAAHYGVPQERWRLIIVGSTGPIAPSHPEPTHYASARANFTGGRTMTFRLDPSANTGLAPAVTVGDALRDLPRLEMGEGGEELDKPRSSMSAYAKALNCRFPKVLNHYASKLAPINRERLKYLKPGGSWRDLPFDLLPAGMKLARRSDHTKRYGRLSYGGLAGTIMTKCDPHWGAVFLPDQDRALTVREAARLQSFPDRYLFLGPRVSQYIQVGNAVPPLLAKAVALSLRTHLLANGVLQEKAS